VIPVSGETRARRIALCPRCKAETLPAKLRSSSLARNALRAAADGMLKPDPDPAAERVRAKKERKAEKAALRTIVRSEGIVSAAKFFLSGQALPLESEECERCQAMQARDAA
jgi:hypothetical protein